MFGNGKQYESIDKLEICIDFQGRKTKKKKPTGKRKNLKSCILYQ